MNGRKRVGRALTILITLCLAGLLACNLYLFLAKQIGGISHPTVFGFSAAVVISGSMEPTISVNDMVVIQDQADYEQGDIITYESGESLITHRIVGQTEEGFLTRGDANQANDPAPVPQELVVGKVVLCLPGVGWIQSYLQTPLGMTCLVLLGLLLLELPFFLEQKRGEDKKEDRNGT